MDRDELIEEISRRKGIPMEEVAEILDEEEAIYDEEAEAYFEEECCKRKKKKLCFFATVLVFLAGVVAALLILDKKEKISIEELDYMVKDNVRKYMDKVRHFNI